MNIDEMQKLLDEFDCLPKIVKQPTYLELCDYPGRRFEEICSRLLEFYLDPNKEHDFHKLFLDSLFEMFKEDIKYQEFGMFKKDIKYQENDIATGEVNAEGKRVDILVTGKSFAIVIENKIDAPLNNPLGEYAKLLEERGYKENERFLMVLSLHPLSNDKIAEATAAGFKCCTYKEYFGIIKRNIGNYMNQGNLKYLAFIMDFIQTLENRSGENIMDMDKKMTDFFKANWKKLDELQTYYQEYKNEPFRQLRKLQEKITERTKESGGVKSEWNIHEDWLLHYDSPSGIQVCATLEEDATICHIYIGEANGKEAEKFWDLNEEIIKRKYQDYEVRPTHWGRRLTVARVPLSEDKDFDPAVEKLYDVYQFVKTLTV
jgi:hypothetical protein